MAVFEELRVFSGNAHPALAEEICSYLGITLGRCEVFKFSNDNTFVRINENIRERDVFLVQPIAVPVNDNLMELWVMIDAAKRASAGRITAVIPYYAYGRTDKKDQPRVAITARLIADFISTAGADRVLTIDLHAGQIQGFFNIPVDELTAVPLLVEEFKNREFKDLVVVATDVGAGKRARDMSRSLGAGIAVIEKERRGNDETVESGYVIGDVSGKTALIVDDEIGTGATVIAAAKALKKNGANDVYCCATHAVLSDNAVKKISESPLKELVVTDTLPLPKEKRLSNLSTVTVSAILGEAIHRIHGGLSVGAMFERR